MNPRFVSVLLLCVVCCFAVADENDLLTEVRAKIPEGWKAELRGDRGKCILSITTHVMETESSPHGNGRPGDIMMTPVFLEFIMLPRLSEKMMLSIKEHNDRTSEKYKGALFGSPAWRELEFRLIDVPDFYDDTVAYKIDYAHRVPTKQTDIALLSDVFAKLSVKWKSYDSKKPNVLKQLRFSIGAH